MHTNIIYNSDSRRITSLISSEIKVQTTITSPPYYDMKDYGVEGQIGYGQTYEKYLEDLKIVFAQVYSITKNDGTLWIIIDTFKRNNAVVTLPFDLVSKLKDIGWLLQDIIIWKKDKTVPWSSSGFIQRKFEYILFFSKGNKYKSNKDKVRVYDTNQLKKWWIKYPERYNPKGKALDEIWEFPIPVQGSWGNEYIRHFCPLPKEMVATMINISTDENDIVFDPFAGSGTVMSQSAYMNRQFIGIEINKQYIEMFKAYLDKTLKEGKREYNTLKNSNNQEAFENVILDLRALKYGRVLLNKIEEVSNVKSLKIHVKRQKPNISGVSKVQYTIYGILPEKKANETIKKIISVPPLSKYGIDPIFIFEEKIGEIKKPYYLYSRTNSYSYMRNVNISNKKVKVISHIKVDLNEKDYD